jgi:hypothetical protein
MRNATDIQFLQISVHIIYPQSPRALLISEKNLHLSGEQKIAEYFSSHIHKSLIDESTRAAQFRVVHESETSGICKSLINGNLNFVEGSQVLARRLYDILEKDKRISSGNLAVGLYKASNYPNIPCYLSLLKIDPSDVFRPQEKQDEQGKHYVGFEVTPDAMPTTREKLQKCAFIQPIEPRPEYDMMLLDRQSQERVTVAQFFSEKFLGAKFALDNQERTERLYKALVSSQNLLRPNLEPQEDELFGRAIRHTVESKIVDVDSFLSSLALRDEHKQKIDTIISEKLPDRKFEIDRDIGEKLLRKRRFRGDYGLKLEVRANDFSQVVDSVEYVEGEDGQPSHYKVTLRTESWEEIP